MLPLASGGPSTVGLVPGSHQRALIGSVALGIGLLLAPVACSRGGSATVPSRSAFEARMRSRESLSVAQARCFTRYAYREFDDAAIVAAYEGGLLALPREEWDSYGHSMVACTMAHPGRAGRR